METFETDAQFVDLSGVTIGGRVLDIGGGGEGVIARRSGGSVVAVDLSREELEEAPDFGLKIIMDARELKFLDRTFDNITCFYSLMYMGERDIKDVLSEAHRVLRDGGGLWLWDVVMPFPALADVFVVQLDIKLPNQPNITTGYGVAWRRVQSAELIEAMCNDAGFSACERGVTGQSFFLRLRKK